MACAVWCPGECATKLYFPFCTLFDCDSLEMRPRTPPHGARWKAAPANNSIPLTTSVSLPTAVLCNSMAAVSATPATGGAGSKLAELSKQLSSEGACVCAASTAAPAKARSHGHASIIHDHVLCSLYDAPAAGLLPCPPTPQVTAPLWLASCPPQPRAAA